MGLAHRIGRYRMRALISCQSIFTRAIELAARPLWRIDKGKMFVKLDPCDMTKRGFYIYYNN